MPTYDITAQQMKDIVAMIDGLNAFDNPADTSRDVDGIEWGGGLRAVISPSSIEVCSDYRDVKDYKEVLGWLTRGDFGWGFTQREPVK